MNKRRTHVSIAFDIDDQIQEYSNLKKISYSEAVSQLVSLGLNNMNLVKTIDRTNYLLDRIYSKSCYTVALLEQIYSDFEWDNSAQSLYVSLNGLVSLCLDPFIFI